MNEPVFIGLMETLKNTKIQNFQENINYLYKLHRNPRFLLPTPFSQPVIGHLGGMILEFRCLIGVTERADLRACTQVDNEVKRDAKMGVQPLVPLNQNLEIDF